MMISKEIIESIECAVPHYCPKKIDSSEYCIFCEIDFSFIADEPVLLECLHHICSECKDKVSNMKCKICDGIMNVSNRKVKSTELLIQSNLRELFQSLKIKFSEAAQFFFNYRNDIESHVDKLEHKIKNEIDQRVEVLIEQIEKARGDLYHQVKQECDKFKEMFETAENQERIFTETNEQLKSINACEITKDNYYLYQKKVKEMIKKIQDKLSNKIKIEFQAYDGKFEMEQLGRLFFETNNSIFTDPNQQIENKQQRLKIDFKSLFKDQMLLASADGEKINIWDINKADVLNTLQGHDGSVKCLKLINSELLASGSNDNTIKIWDFKSGNVVKTLNKHKNRVSCLQVLNSQLLASGSVDGSINIWNIMCGNVHRKLAGHSITVSSIKVVSKDLLASGSHDKTIKIWNYENGTLINTLNEHEKLLYCLEPIGSQLLASGSLDSTIKIWDFHKGRIIKKFTGHSDSVQCLLFLNSKHLASASADATIKIWDVNNGTAANTLLGHTSGVLCLELINSGLLASGSYDKTIKIWHIKTGNLLQTLNKHHFIVRSIQLLKP